MAKEWTFCFPKGSMAQNQLWVFLIFTILYIRKKIKMLMILLNHSSRIPRENGSHFCHFYRLRKHQNLKILQLLSLHLMVPETIVVWVNGASALLLILCIPVHNSMDNILHFCILGLLLKQWNTSSKLEDNKFYLKCFNKSP